MNVNYRTFTYAYKGVNRIKPAENTVRWWAFANMLTDLPLQFLKQLNNYQ